MMMRGLRCMLLLLLAGGIFTTTGCRYVVNRYFDARDVFAVGAGLTGENPVTGIVPPSLGVYVEATDWLHLGAIHYNGYTAELDLRGSYIGPESETRFGLLWWQMIRKNQAYPRALFYNYFKDEDALWCHRMEGLEMRHDGHPAKRLHYEHYQQYLIRGTGLLHRGWHYWEYAGFEAAICEPFVTHAGAMIRAGFDLSEVADFTLGLACIDFKHDDLSPAMLEEMIRGKAQVVEQPVAVETPAPAPVPVPAPAVGPSQEDLDKLKSENDQLKAELEKVKGKLSEYENAIEIELPEAVLFDTGKATLRPEGKQLLDKLAGQIKTQYPGYKMSLEGHTDDQPVKYSGWKSNWELGAARALTVLHYLTDVAGLPKAYAATTYADNKPVAGNDTPEGRQKNRRSVVVLRGNK